MKIHMAELLAYAYKGMTVEIERTRSQIQQTSINNTAVLKALSEACLHYYEQREVIDSIFKAYESLPYYIVLIQNEDSFSLEFKPKSPDQE